MCGETMTFPDTVEEFMERYKMVDREQVYSNGVEYVPIFRMKQWFEHANEAEPVRHGRWIPCETGWICSQCGWYDAFAKCREFKEGVPYSQMPMTLLRDRFCPNCGAKMEDIANEDRE